MIDAAAGQVGLGEARLAAGHALPGTAAGETVVLALRPEAISLLPFAGASNRLAATVRDVTFLGPVVRLRLVLDAKQSSLKTSLKQSNV